MQSMTTSTASLLVGFLGVCNEALARRRDSFPSKQLFGLYEKLFAERDLLVTIYEDDPGEAIGRVAIRYVDGRYEPVSGSSERPAFSVKLKRSYMDHVIANSDEYTAHPDKLDWDWLKSLSGLASQTGATKVRDVMTAQLRPVPHDVSIKEASRMMRDLGIGGMPVVDGRTLIGMITDRDITVRATAKGADPNITPVRTVMTSRIASCRQDARIGQAAGIMRNLHIRRLIVLDEAQHPVGIITLGDIAARTNNQQLVGSLLADITTSAVSR